MQYDHNPRMGGRKATAAKVDPELFEDVSLSSTRTPYLGKRTISISRSKKKNNSTPNKKQAPSETDTLTSAAADSELLSAEQAVSAPALGMYGLTAWMQQLYTITLVCLVAAQASAELSVKVLLLLLLVHNFLAAMLLGMHHTSAPRASTWSTAD
jgi:hypothetical protein